jgi:hypothetical protein
MKQIFANGPYGPLKGNEGMITLPFGDRLAYSFKGERLEYGTAGEYEEIPEKGRSILIIAGGNVSYIPTLPELPLVVRMDHSLVISPKNEITTTVPVPLIPAIAVPAPKGRYEVLARFPLPYLSKTWFGDPVAGEPAYSLPFTLPGKAGGRKPDYGIALCPLTIRNASSELLDFQRLILRVPAYSLYCRGDDFLTDAVTVRFRGVEQVSQVGIGTASDYPGDLSLFAGPAVKKDPIGLRRSFYFIKSLAAL